MSDNTSLAEIFLGFGGRTAQVLGTVFTAAGVLYAINKSSGHGISVLETLPYWLGLKTDPKADEKALTRKQLYDESTAYGKLLLLIGSGVLIKKFGTWALSEGTVGMFNAFLYKK